VGKGGQPVLKGGPKKHLKYRVKRAKQQQEDGKNESNYSKGAKTKRKTGRLGGDPPNRLGSVTRVLAETQAPTDGGNWDRRSTATSKENKFFSERRGHPFGGGGMGGREGPGEGKGHL